MKPFSTLFAKILLWFFLNLALVAGMFAVFFTVQFQNDLQGLLGMHARDRMRTAARIISHELEFSPKAEWPDILGRHSEIHQVDFLVITSNEQIGTTTVLSLPPTVKAEVDKALAFDFRRHARKRIVEEFFDKGPPGATDMEAMDSRRRGDRGPKLILKTKNPTRYWTGVYMSLFHSPRRPPEKAVLLAASDSLTGNGFFFDPYPWIIAASLVALFSVVFWTPLVRHITKPLERMTQAAEKIALGRFDVRIEERRADEIGRLGRAINHMTNRLAGYVTGQKRFLGDVAHELGSPIARIQFGLGILEQRCDEKNRERVRDVLEDVAHMSNLVNELLSFSRAEISPEKVKLGPVDAAAVVEKAKNREIRPGVDIHVAIPPGAEVYADAELLTRAVSNLLRNAVRYAGNDGPVKVEANVEKEEVEIKVTDSGPGVAEELMDRLFEPFYRPEPSRNRQSGGVGLGLAIVKTCVNACKGSVSASNLKPKGFAVAIRLRKRDGRRSANL